MHRTIVYPNGMVEVEFDVDDLAEPGSASMFSDAAELGCCGIEDTEGAETLDDCLSDALDLLEAHFVRDIAASTYLSRVRQIHNEGVWAADKAAG